MQTYTVTRYEFGELSPEAQGVALTEARESLYITMPEEFISEDIRQALAEALGGEHISTIGLELRYSLGYSQGDGASFTGRLTPETAPSLSWPTGADYADLRAIDHHYSHAYTVRAELYDSEGEELDDSPEVSIFRQQIKDISRDLERAGYKSIEDYSSEEAARYECEERGAIYLNNGKAAAPVGISEGVSA